MSEEYKTSELWNRFLNTDEIPDSKWCELCQHSHNFCMDGMGNCSMKNNELVYYCETCDNFALDAEKQKLLR